MANRYAGSNVSMDRRHPSRMTVRQRFYLVEVLAGLRLTGARFFAKATFDDGKPAAADDAVRLRKRCHRGEGTEEGHCRRSASDHRQLHAGSLGGLRPVPNEIRGEFLLGIRRLEQVLDPAGQGRGEAERFFRDLCTLGELHDLAQRWQVVRLLDQGRHYAEISHETGASTATVTRIAGWLRHGTGGYASALERTRERSPAARHAAEERA